MVSDKLVNKWLEEGIINQKQANKMLADIKKSSKDKTSRNLIVTFSTIGVILVGLAAILFVGSNWRDMPNLVKFLLLAIVTVASYIAGHKLRYSESNYPTVGNALILLSSLLFGATIILTAQMYNWSVNNHWYLLIWMLGIIPLVYMYKNNVVAAILGILFLLWIGFFIFRGANWGGIRLIPSYFVIGAVMMNVGAFHYLKKDFSGIARIYRLLGLKVMMLSLFLMTFEFVTKLSQYRIDNFDKDPLSITLSFTVFSVLAIVFMLYNLIVNPAKIPTSKYENGIGLFLMLMTMLLFFKPIAGYAYLTVFNLIFAGIIVVLFYLGNTLRDSQIMNLAMLYFGIFVFAKYFDFFFGMLQTSVFMLIGGVLLVGGSIFLERKRRVLNEEFKKKGAPDE